MTHLIKLNFFSEYRRNLYLSGYFYNMAEKEIIKYGNSPLKGKKVMLNLSVSRPTDFSKN